MTSDAYVDARRAKRSVASAPRPQKAQALPQEHEADLQEEKIQQEMEKYLGVRYKRGGNSTKGFDCSGFVKQVYSEVFGVDLPHQSSQHKDRCSFLTKVSSDELRTGDLVFFSGGRKKREINHVGIYLSDGKFIHSSRTKGVVISSLEDPYWKPRFAGGKRLADRDSLMASLDSKSMFGLGMTPDGESLLTFQVMSSQLPSFSSSQVHHELLQVSNDAYYRTEFTFLKSLWTDSWTKPFEVAGAPYIDDGRWAEEMNRAGLAGIRFVPIRFTPKASVFRDQPCGGVSLVVTDRETCAPVDVGLTLAVTLQRLYPGQFALDKVQTLLQHRPTLDAIRDGKPLAEIKQLWACDLAEFRQRREPFLLYP